MKKIQYICPVTEVVRVNCENHLMAASAGKDINVGVNAGEEYNGVFRAPRNPNLWNDENEEND